jgi:hypothetical protein
VRIRLAIPDHLVTPQTLEAALEATTLANESSIARGEIPPLTEAIRKGLRWKPEPFLDGEHFDLADVVARRNWGDCDDLAPWLAGELRATGEDPDARPRVYQSGPNRWHVVVETGDGQILDPSIWAGMRRGKGGEERAGVAGVTARPMAPPGTGALVVMPHRGEWWGRCDLPWPNAAGHIASHARAATPDLALMHALDGAIQCGDEIDSPLVDRAAHCGDMLLEGAEVGFLGLLTGLGGLAAGIGRRIKKRRQKRKSSAKKKKRQSALTRLAHGESKHVPPGSIVSPDGSVSVPLERGCPDHGQHMFLSYYPPGSPGPVIMRF